MNRILQNINKNLEIEKDFFPSCGELLFAVSGGPDSVALVDITADNFPSIKIRMHIAYIHHGLRKNADRERDFVKKIAERWDMPFHWKKIDVRETNGRSLEEQARIKRYNALIEIAKKHNCVAIVTAHTCDDLAETVIFNLLNGAGLKGLCGIHPSTTMENGILLLRPLLSLSKKQILSYLNAKKLPYMIDESNFDIKFKRNFIRHKIFPGFEKINPAFKKNIFKTSKILSDDFEYISICGKKILEKWFIIDTHSAKFSRENFVVQHKSIQRFIIREILTRICKLLHPPDFTAVENIRNAIISNNNRHVEKYKISIIHADKNIIIQYAAALKKIKPSQFRTVLNIPGQTKLPVLNWLITAKYRKFEKRFLKNPDRLVAYINAHNIKNNLIIRTPEMNSYFVPLGMDTSVRFRKYWKTHKKHITGFIEMPVVVQDSGKIVWVVGGHISNEYAIKNGSRILEIRAKKL